MITSASSYNSLTTPVWHIRRVHCPYLSPVLHIIIVSFILNQFLWWTPYTRGIVRNNTHAYICNNSSQIQIGVLTLSVYCSWNVILTHFFLTLIIYFRFVFIHIHLKVSATTKNIFNKFFLTSSVIVLSFKWSVACGSVFDWNFNIVRHRKRIATKLKMTNSPESNKQVLNHGWRFKSTFTSVDYQLISFFR